LVCVKNLKKLGSGSYRAPIFTIFFPAELFGQKKKKMEGDVMGHRATTGNFWRKSVISVRTHLVVLAWTNP
jgi:hypothetical protein